MKSLFVVYINQDTYLETWADTVKEDPSGTLSFFFEYRETARVRVWMYWYVKDIQ